MEFNPFSEPARGMDLEFNPFGPDQRGMDLEFNPFSEPARGMDLEFNPFANQITRNGFGVQSVQYTCAYDDSSYY